jgi:Fe2+ or Zn2+ uptake regulation protein
MNRSLGVVSHLRESGFKVTKYRVALVELFENYTEPLSVGEIVDRLASSTLYPNKTTLYRELDFLVGAGLVREIDLGDSRKRYELYAREHHHHLVCKQCERIEDVVLEEDIVLMERKIAKMRNFEVKSHMLEFFGLCSHCR